MATGKALEGLHVVGIRYLNSQLVDSAKERCLEIYQNSGVFAEAGVPFSYSEPHLADAIRRPSEPDNIGLLGGCVADDVAAARRIGKAVMMVGGNCTHITGVVGGLQDAHGPAARIGLVWFDAHGDFNTPRTTLSGMLGGMPVAVCAGLAFPYWREQSHIVSPLPTERILMVDVRNLDKPEEQLIRATDITIARVAPGFYGDVELQSAVAELAERCDYIYFHIDSDILDERFVPNHNTREPNGPDMAQVHAAIDTVMATGKVAAYAVVSISGKGEGAEISYASGVELIRGGLAAWQRYGGA